MANIQHLLDKIRTAIYGKEVRGSLADGLEAINKETEDATEVAVNVEQRQDAVEQQFDDVLNEWTSDKPISNEETIAARTNRKTGDNYTSLGQRLDAESEKVNAQLAETEQQINQLESKKAERTYVNEVDRRLSAQLAETVDEFNSEMDYLEGFNYSNLKLSIENNPNLVNMIKNGDFKKGVEPWEVFVNSAEISLQDGKMLIRGSGSSRYPRVRQTTDVGYSIGDVIYIYADFIALNEKSNSFGFQVYGNDDNNILLASMNDYKPYEESTFSQNITIPDNFEGNLRIQIRPNYSTPSDADGSEILVDNVNFINLTKLFGKGNEPSADDMKILIAMFNGYIPHEVKNTINSSIFGYLRQRPVVSKRPLIALTFDDNFKTDIDMVYPILQERGIRATTYVITGDVGTGRKMDWDDLRFLRSVGWTIGCHSHDHINLGNATDQEIRNQMQLVNQTMLNNGFSIPDHHSLPFGGGRENPRVLNILKDYRKTVRQTGGNPFNDYDTVDFYNIYGKQADINDSNINRLNLRKSDIDATIANNGFLVLYAHEQFASGAVEDWQGNIDNLIELIDYALAKGVEFVTMDDLYRRILNYQMFAIAQLEHTAQ